MDFDLENTIMHDLVFWGNSREELLDFPDEPRREAGYQLHKVQVGEQPADFKPMTIVGLESKNCAFGTHPERTAFFSVPASIRPSMSFTPLRRNHRRPRHRT